MQVITNYKLILKWSVREDDNLILVELGEISGEAEKVSLPDSAA